MVFMHVKSFEWGSLPDSYLAPPSHMTLFWYITPSLAPRALLYLPSKRELHIAMGMTQNLTLVGTNVKRTQRWKKRSKKPEMWFKKTPQKKLKAKREHVQWIKRHKCGPRRFPKERQAKRRSTCSSAFPVAGIAFAFFFVVVFARVLCVPVRGGLAESYLAGKSALAVGCEHFCCPFANVHRLHFVVCPSRVYQTARQACFSIRRWRGIGA